MFASLAAIISPTFFHDLIAQTPVHIIAVSATVFAVIKGVRKLVPDLSPRWTLLLNLALSIAGLFASMSPANFWSETTLTQLGVLVVSAGGIHSIWNAVKGVPNKSEPPSDPPPPGAATVALLLIAALTASLALGCVHQAAAPGSVPPPSIYQRGAAGMSDFATDLLQAQSIERNLYTGGVIDAATHRVVEDKFHTIALYGIQVDGLLRAEASPATIAAKIGAALDAISSITVSAASLDPATTAKVNAGVEALKVLLTNLLTIFGPSVSLAPPSPQQTVEVDRGSSSYRNTRGRGRDARPYDLQPSETGSARQDRRYDVALRC